MLQEWVFERMDGFMDRRMNVAVEWMEYGRRNGWG